MKRLFLLCGLAALLAAPAALAGTASWSSTVSGTKRFSQSFENSGGSFTVHVDYSIKWASHSVFLFVDDSTGTTICQDAGPTPDSPSSLDCVVSDASAGTYTVRVTTVNGKPVPITVTVTGSGIS